MTARSELTPHMSAYAEQFADDSAVRWLPHLIYFHPAHYRSQVVNTDEHGFRYSCRGDTRYSVADPAGCDSVRLIAGSSTVFGIGASADRWTLASRMSERDRRPQPWLNFGGRSFNSAQELLLLVLYRHLLPAVEEIVLFSGFNNLGLARQPAGAHTEHGAFFMYRRWLAAFDGREPRPDRGLRGMLRARPRPDEPEPEPPDLPEQLRRAADLTIRHLEGWRVLAADWGAKLTYVLQPLAGWVRPHGTAEEEALFAELDAAGHFSTEYGDILHPDVCARYAALLESGAKAMGVGFVNLNPILSECLRPDQWLFVDRIHLTDSGHDLVARKVLEAIYRVSRSP
jgi:hypothetical protein